MNAYYQDEFVTIYHGDCREVLTQLEPVDLVLTDPPYGLKWKELGFNQATKTDWASASKWDVRPDKATLELITGFASQWIIWGGNYFAKDLGDCKAPLVWDKQTGANKFADGELAFTSFKTGTLRIFRHQWCGAFKATEKKQRAMHPTQKPVALMKWCILQVRQVQVVLDPFMDSGTTLRAAKDLGLQAIGVEIEEKYCEIAAKRMAQSVFNFAQAL